ncbi:Ankyrin repeat protein [Apiospora kogelbergensis]|uniref:Ankyrin repeat protein n=1 Tax=Apiospora kogelbergensis TaxID=1337665 RepID=UPI0031320E38
MAALPPPPPGLLWQPRDYSAWDANRDRIYDYYIIRNKTRPETKRLMEECHAFPDFPLPTWEHVLREHFKFRKNLGDDEWAFLAQTLSGRRRLGKETFAVHLCGRPIPNRSIVKNIGRKATRPGESMAFNLS